MSPRALKLLALVLVLGGIAGIVGLSQRGNVREYVLKSFEVTSRDGDSYVLQSGKNVTDTAKQISGTWKPAETLVDPGGTFLRYKGDIVAVTPRAEGGSTVYLDDEERGYNHWFPYVVGFWGFGGTGGSIGGTRGGGPGTGK